MTVVMYRSQQHGRRGQIIDTRKPESGIVLCTYQCQARGGAGSGNPREFDCGVYPQGGDFDQTSCISSFNFIE